MPKSIITLSLYYNPLFLQQEILKERYFGTYISEYYGEGTKCLSPSGLSCTIGQFDSIRQRLEMHMNFSF